MSGSQPLTNRANVSVRATKQRGDNKPHGLSKNQLGLQTNSARISKSKNPKYGTNSRSSSSFPKAHPTNTTILGKPHVLTSQQQGFIAKRAELAAIATRAGDKPDDSNSTAPVSGTLELTSSFGNTIRQSSWTAANGFEPPVWLRVDKYTKLTKKDNSWAMSTPKLVFKIVVYEKVEPAVKDKTVEAGKMPVRANKAKKRTPATSTSKRAAK